MRYCDGYTDLLGPSAPARRSLAQRAMISPAVAAIDQHIWRPFMVAAMSPHGMSIEADRERAAAALQLGGRQRVLDVACGPGNFTSFFAGQLAGDGFVIGLDNSAPRSAGCGSSTAPPSQPSSQPPASLASTSNCVGSPSSWSRAGPNGSPSSGGGAPRQERRYIGPT